MCHNYLNIQFKSLNVTNICQVPNMCQVPCYRLETPRGGKYGLWPQRRHILTQTTSGDGCYKRAEKHITVGREHQVKEDFCGKEAAENKRHRCYFA